MNRPITVRPAYFSSECDTFHLLFDPLISIYFRAKNLTRVGMCELIAILLLVQPTLPPTICL